MLLGVESAPAIVDDRDRGDGVGRRAVALRVDGSGALLVLDAEVVGFGDGGLLVALVAQVQLLLVGCLVIDQVLGLDQFVVLEQVDCAHLEAAAQSISLLDVGGVVD